MKSLVFLSLFYFCSAGPAFFLQDTPEVMMEKRRFQQLYNAAAAAAAAAPDTNAHHNPGKHFGHIHNTHNPGNTHRFNTHHNVQQFQPRQFQQQQFQPRAHIQSTPRWTGPQAANVPAGLPGSVAQVQNTPEVNAAISQFNRAYNAALTRTGARTPTGHHNNPIHHAPRTHFTNPIPQTQPRWTGPWAATVPAGLPGSTNQVGETPEVQQARNAFNQAFNRQLSTVFG